MVVVAQSSMLLLRIWNREMKMKGMMKARKAASQIGMISLSSGHEIEGSIMLPSVLKTANERLGAGPKVTFQQKVSAYSMLFYSPA